MAAVISECGRYRYSLTRVWGDLAEPRMLFVMLNPSTADATRDDPTIRRCIGFAKAAGASSLEVVNLFALRSTDPAALETADDPVGPRNDRYIEIAAGYAKWVVCAWGAHRMADVRGQSVLALIRERGREPLCLRQTKHGHPSHPLYLPATLRPVPMEARHAR